MPSYSNQNANHQRGINGRPRRHYLAPKRSKDQVFLSKNLKATRNSSSSLPFARTSRSTDISCQLLSLKVTSSSPLDFELLVKQDGVPSSLPLLNRGDETLVFNTSMISLMIVNQDFRGVSQGSIANDGFSDVTVRACRLQRPARLRFNYVTVRPYRLQQWIHFLRLVHPQCRPDLSLGNMREDPASHMRLSSCPGSGRSAVVERKCQQGRRNGISMSVAAVTGAASTSAGCNPLSSSLSMIVVEECSFVSSHHLHQLDWCLQKKRETPTLFLTVVTGDFNGKLKGELELVD